MGRRSSRTRISPQTLCWLESTLVIQCRFRPQPGFRMGSRIESPAAIRTGFRFASRTGLPASVVACQTGLTSGHALKSPRYYAQRFGPTDVGAGRSPC